MKAMASSENVTFVSPFFQVIWRTKYALIVVEIRINLVPEAWGGKTEKLSSRAHFVLATAKLVVFHFVNYRRTTVKNTQMKTHLQSAQNCWFFFFF